MIDKLENVPRETLTILPYVDNGGSWTLPDSAVKAIWDLLAEEGTAHRVFCTGSPASDDSFLAYFKNPSHPAVTVWEGGNIAWISWLTGINDGWAMVHATGFKIIWGRRSEECMRTALTHWFGFTKPDGTPYFSTLVAVIPDSNRLAVRLGKKAGLHEVGVIPGLIQDVYQGSRVGSTILYARREDYVNG